MLTRYLIQLRRLYSVENKSQIMKYLCVAEKNSAAKTISQFLSRGSSQTREGFSPYNKIYYFDMDFRGQKTNIVFTSVSGHLLTLEFDRAHRSWMSCNPQELFDAPVMRICPEVSEKIKKTLEREVRTCNGLIIWTDCDREGENIGFEIIEVCRAVKPSITVQRAKFSDMTSASLNRAMNNLIQPDERVSRAVDVRSELDLRIGAAFTRFQTLRLKNIFPNDITSDIVSYGSCQIPTLGFVAQRYKEIENFVPKSFWKLKLSHKIENLTVEFNWARNRLFDRPCVEAFLMLCRADGQAKITNVLQKPKNKWRPQPMDTIELEKTGSRKLKLSAKKIMTIAEKLYTQGFISYPRTETNQFSKDMNLRALVEMQVPHRDWGDFAGRVLEWGPNPRNGNKSDQAHPPIHPTKFTATLHDFDEKRVYELVVRHFLACVSRDAVGSETVVNAEIGNEEFTATGLVIFERNYLDVYPYDNWKGKEIHRYEMGQMFTPTELGIHEGKTEPPANLKEADLIALMEKHGIGTDATHADHINTIKERDYIGELNEGQLVPGTLGMGLFEGYESMNLQFTGPKLRAGLEVDLKRICEGTKDPQVVLAEQIQKYRECFEIIVREAALLDQAIGVRLGKAPAQVPQIEIPTVQKIFKCPKCRTSSMVLKRKRDDTASFISCQGYPECRNAIWFGNDVKEVQMWPETCGNCGGENKKVKLKFSSVSMLGLVYEKPEYSRIEGSHYITCLVCDDTLRRLLSIPTDTVKVLGNIVGAGTRPVQQNFGNSNPHLRGFNTSSAPANPPIQRRNWNNDDDDDDDRPQGGGAVAVAVNRNQSTNRPNFDRTSQNRGWNSGEPAVTSSNNRNQYGNNNQTAGRSNNPNQSWSNKSSGPSDNKKKQSSPKLPNCSCKIPVARLETKKEGPNHGRFFYTCKNRVCGFFHWADQPLPANMGGNAGGSNGEKAKRKCSICKQEGHNKLNCPYKTDY